MKNIILVLISIVFFSCSNKKEIAYFENGKLKYEVNLRNGLREGEFISYCENGEIELKANYLNGKLNGSSIKYFSNGEIKEIANYLNGKLDGSSIKYFSNGKIKEIANYDKGEIISDIVKFDLYGNIKKIEKYKDSKLYGLKYFDSKGNLTFSTPFLYLTSDKDTITVDEIFQTQIQVVGKPKDFNFSLSFMTDSSKDGCKYKEFSEESIANFVNSTNKKGINRYKLRALFFKFSSSRSDTASASYFIDYYGDYFVK